MFKSGGKTAFGIPMTMAEVTDEVLDEYFPPEDYIRSWHEGDDVDWPPPYDESDDENADEGDLQQVPLRFNIGDAVECRIGADPVTGWAGGKVAMLWYRESNWPKNSKAPYQVQLDDGKLIFAPVDKVKKLPLSLSLYFTELNRACRFLAAFISNLSLYSSSLFF